MKHVPTRSLETSVTQEILGWLCLIGALVVPAFFLAEMLLLQNDTALYKRFVIPYIAPVVAVALISAAGILSFALSYTQNERRIRYTAVLDEEKES